MDFFKSQDTARRKTSILVGYYCVAVVLIILAVYLAVAAVFQGAMIADDKVKTFSVKALWNPDLFLWITGITVLIVISGTAFKISQLSQGGGTVAQMLGGREVNPNSRDLNERKILNVVEEMAIASGIPVPTVFILDNEEGINAFAAGFSPSDAVIGVTRGCVTQLTRDELQGVVAHEFSHIFNGDMRLNIRLLGTLNGILVIGIIGYWIFRTAARSSSRGSSKQKGGTLPFIVVGLLIWLIGYIGVLFGKLIKSAVSRQREYLADASAVQFTRNPAGISGALKKIAGFVQGSKITSERAEEASHFFFSNGLAQSFLNLMATHPPIEDRIARLDPYFKMELAEKGKEARAAAPPAGEAAEAVAGVSQFTIKPAEVVSRVGAPKPEHVAYAAGLISSLPDDLTQAMREPSSARALVYCLLLNKEPEVRGAQLKYLAGQLDKTAYAQVEMLVRSVDAIGEDRKIPLVDIAIPALKRLSLQQYAAFRKDVEYLVSADKEVDLFEYTLQRILLRHLTPAFEKPRQASVHYYDIKPLLPGCGRLLSCLAYWGTDDAAEAGRAFEEGIRKLGSDVPLKLSPVNLCGLPMVDEVLNHAVTASPMIRKRILDACVTCIGADGVITIEEAELIRAVADSMDCPLPPFLPGKLN
jgi:Zn-dependent protease with chaperone function